MGRQVAVKVFYSAFIPKAESAIGRDVPAHVVLEWHDEEGRVNRMHLDCSEHDVENIGKMPTVCPVCGYEAPCAGCKAALTVPPAVRAAAERINGNQTAMYPADALLLARYILGRGEDK